MRIAAIDQGTTSTRVLLADTTGHAEIAASRRHRTTYPRPGWVEQDAEELLANIRATLTEAGPVDAVGLANQGESCLAWDAETGKPLSPVIVWQDVRTAEKLAAMERDGFGPEAAARSGLPLDPYFSASKLAWTLQTLPAAADARRAGKLRLGTTDAFFLDRLTGHFATDRATASRTGLMNIETGEWDEVLCRMFGVPRECLPEIRGNIAGFGAVGGTPVAAAIVDQQAALYGHGCRREGEAKVTFGTGAFALAVTGGRIARDAQGAGLLPTVAWDLGDGIVYALDGGVQDAGSAVEWALRAGLAERIKDFSSFSGPSALGRGLVFVPAFSGLGCPWWDRSASPLILGLHPEMTRADICRALLEGIAMLTAIVVAAMGAHCPLSRRLSIDGGLSKSPCFAQALADCTDLEIAAGSFAERTAWGTAALAAKALGAELPAPAQEEVMFAPSAGFPADWREKFERAVGRARSWR